MTIRLATKSRVRKTFCKNGKWENGFQNEINTRGFKGPKNGLEMGKAAKKKVKLVQKEVPELFALREHVCRMCLEVKTFLRHISYSYPSVK